MLEAVPDFTLVMTWLILALNGMAVALLIGSAYHLLDGRRRALLGCLAMGGILIALGVMLWVETRGSRADGSVSQRFLPLLSSILIAGLYWLTFPGREKP